MKLVIQLVLWIVILFLGYLIFNSIYEPIQFNEIKEDRYAKVIEKLEDIRDAELAYRDVTGHFAGTFEELIEFIDTAQFTLTQRRDTTVLDEEYARIYGVDKYIEKVLIDTLGYSSVQDSLFGNENFKNLMEVPIEGADAEFQLEAGTIMVNETEIPVFEAKIAKAKVLYDLDPDLVRIEEEVIAVDQVEGAYIKVGSMEEVNTNGNWPRLYAETAD
ncbi:MAG TPA: hypothetical protein VFI78_00900 [Salinimicrobium sp.]|nr:hypothetical protein [Salinimicrobium sp.]